jgi:hypothetical protein
MIVRTSVHSASRLVLTSIACLSLGATARADEAADTAAARQIGGDGVMLAEAGKCKQAIEKLERAEKLHHAPTTAERLGECEVEVGKIVSGTERLNRLLREPLPPNAPPAFTAAIERARKVLQTAQPKIANLRISVKAPPGTQISVQVDGEAVPEAILDNDRPTDPGAHKITATAQGFFPASTGVTLGDGDSRPVSLELQPDPNAPPPPQPTTPGPDNGSSSQTSSGSRLPAYVAFGVGGLGLGVGIVAGAVVASRASSLSRDCDANKACPADQQSHIDAAKTWATISTVGFIVGGVGLGTGLVLLLTGGKSSTTTARPHVSPVLGANYAGIDGTF